MNDGWIITGDHKHVWQAKTPLERQHKCRAQKKERRLDRIAVLDMETDPFDNKKPEHKIAPFAACLYSDNFAPILIWEENEALFIERVISEIEALPDSYTIYAHNGGKFDFMFFISRLRGQVMFKGRGIMSAKVGRHELRDSFHLIPEKLASYQKQQFDYENMRKSKRKAHKDQIISYLISDCKYLLDIVKAFLGEYGFKISIGQAAMAELKKHYKVKSLCNAQDAFLRHFFFGGRVECLEGKGIFDGDYKYYDVNSMYPFVMANRMHPIGNEYIQRRGKPGPNTVFMQIECDNFGALVKRSDNNETVAPFGRHVFWTTIWEHDVSVKYNLIKNVKYNFMVDCAERSNFASFVTPLYLRRQTVKATLRAMAQTGDDESEVYLEQKRWDIFYKLILNNAYGKFAQNPRRFKEHYLSDVDARPPSDTGEWGDFPSVETDEYFVWSRPNPKIHFNNVGTAASITGAARAVLLEALQHAKGAIYCDTDSIICKSLECSADNSDALGDWTLEKEFSSVIIAGKKLYAYRERNGKEKIKSKGAAGLEWNDMLALLAGEIVETINKAPTLSKTGTQVYMRRNIRATAGVKKHGNNSTGGASRKPFGQRKSVSANA